MNRKTAQRESAPNYIRFSSVPAGEQGPLLADCLSCADALYEGLDLSSEIQAVAGQGLGDTVVLSSGDRVEGFAVCHAGPDTEAGSGVCYVKFAAVRPGAHAARHFAELIGACEELAIDRGAGLLSAGVNTACAEACQALLDDGFRIAFNGISMHAPNEPAYCRPGLYACSDWR